MSWLGKQRWTNAVKCQKVSSISSYAPPHQVTNNLYMPQMFMLELPKSPVCTGSENLIYFLFLVCHLISFSPLCAWHTTAFDHILISMLELLNMWPWYLSVKPSRAHCWATIPRDTLARYNMSNHPSRRLDCSQEGHYDVLQCVASKRMRVKRMSKGSCILCEPRNTERDYTAGGCLISSRPSSAWSSYHVHSMCTIM